MATSKSKAEPKRQSNPVGRPRMYKTPEDMWQKAEEYLGTTTKPSISALALYLGFTDRHSLYDYEYRYPEFANTIKKIRGHIVSHFEQMLANEDNKNNTGPIFMLKNFGYSDKIDIEQNTTETKKIEITVAPEVSSVLDSLRSLSHKEELKVIEHQDEETSDND